MHDNVSTFHVEAGTASLVNGLSGSVPCMSWGSPEFDPWSGLSSTRATLQALAASGIERKSLHMKYWPAIYVQGKIHVTTLFINSFYNAGVSRNFVASDVMRKAVTLQQDGKLENECARTNVL